ncbi:MAG TPA: PHB depolymerase family esterase [Thermoanaerobaculia bacterium]|nr:PHB depolymerase family esterase [Thermoanaerobaculia bacterium]
MSTDFLLRHVESGGGTRDFRVYVPPDYDDDHTWPAVLFLHGAGERGNDSVTPTKVGIGPHLYDREPYPAIVVFPQCPAESHWSAPAARAIAAAALDSVISEFRIDAARIALTGISMGAAGAWLLASDQTGRFASLAPVCGWLSSRAKRDFSGFVKGIAHIPTWIFHGDADTIVPVDESRIMHAALEAAGAQVRYTELKGVGHNSWDPAYGESGLMEWLVGEDPRTRGPENSK